MVGKAKKKRAGKGKAAPKKAKKPKARVVAKAKTAAKKGKAKPAPKKPKAPPKVHAKSKSAAKAKPAAKKAAPKPAHGDALLQTEILAIARQVYGDRSDAQLLALDPNSVDEMDPATFYEMIAEKFGVQGDPADQNFGGFGGPIRNLIAFVGARWDGKTRGDAPMPPQEWLDEFVHPATERVPSQAEPQDEPLLD